MRLHSPDGMQQCLAPPPGNMKYCEHERHPPQSKVAIRTVVIAQPASPLMNLSTTDSPRAPAWEEFLIYVRPRSAACALLMNSRTTDSLRAPAWEEFLIYVRPRSAACALLITMSGGLTPPLVRADLLGIPGHCLMH